jgi:hypothetical protein
MVSKIETGAYAGAPTMLEAIRRTLEYTGVEFTNGSWRLAVPNLRISL